MKVRAASIDIGSKNLGLYIEDFDVDVLQSIPKVKCKIDRSTGLPSEDYLSLLYKVYKEGSRVVHEKIDMTKEPFKCRDYKDDNVLLNIIAYLDRYKKLWDTCAIFVLERQMKKNYVASKIQWIIYSYFVNRYGPFKVVTDIQASRKTKILGAPLKMTKPKRKDWAVSEAIKILKVRGDLRGLTDLEKKGKKDDLGDSLVQLQAFKVLLFIEGRL